MTDDELRVVAQATGDVLDQRVIPMEERLAQLEERTAECERLLRIEAEELHDAAYDGWSSGDEGVFWSDMDQRRVKPGTAQKMVERKGYGRA